MTDVKDLVSATDIADLLGVSQPAVSNWKVRNIGFPEPIHTVARGKVELFDINEVIDWHLTRHPQMRRLVQHINEQER